MYADIVTSTGDDYLKDVFKMESEEFSLGSKNISFQFVEIHMELSEVSSALDNGTVLILLNIQHL